MRTATEELVYEASDEVRDAVIDGPYSPGHDWVNGEPDAILHDLIREAQTVSCPECGGGGATSRIGPEKEVQAGTGSPPSTVVEHHVITAPCPTCKGRKCISQRYAGWLEAAEHIENLAAGREQIGMVNPDYLRHAVSAMRGDAIRLRSEGARQEEERNADRD